MSPQKRKRPRSRAEHRPPAPERSPPPSLALAPSPAAPQRLAILGQDPPVIERADAARNRAAILAAARKLLERRPIGEICMDELADAAGVGKGTLYRRFADRASLIRALLHDDALELQARVLAGFGLPASTPWIDRLDHLLEALFEFAVEHVCLLAEAAAFERGVAGRFEHPAYVWQRDTIAIYLERAVKSGDIRAVSAQPTADFILAALDPDLIGWHLAHGTSREQLRLDFRGFWRLGVLGPRKPEPAKKSRRDH